MVGMKLGEASTKISQHAHTYISTSIM